MIWGKLKMDTVCVNLVIAKVGYQTIRKMTTAKIADTIGKDMDNLTRLTFTDREARTHNSTYPKGGVSCSKDSFEVNGSLVFQIKFCGKNPALRVAAKRWAKSASLLLPIGSPLSATLLGQCEQKLRTVTRET